MRHYYAHGWNDEVGAWALYAFETRKERDAFCAVCNNFPLTYAEARSEYMRPWDGKPTPHRYREYDPYTHELVVDYGQVLTYYKL